MSSPVSRDQLFPLVRQHDVFIMASEIEGGPLTLLEAMALGLVPICNDISVPDPGSDSSRQWILHSSRAPGVTLNLLPFSIRIGHSWSTCPLPRAKPSGPHTARKPWQSGTSRLLMALPRSRARFRGRRASSPNQFVDSP